MDRFFAGGDWCVHDVLSPAVPKTNRRRADHAFTSKAKNKNDQSGSCCGNYTLARSSDWKSSSLADIRCSRSSRAKVTTRPRTFGTGRMEAEAEAVAS